MGDPVSLGLLGDMANLLREIRSTLNDIRSDGRCGLLRAAATAATPPPPPESRRWQDARALLAIYVGALFVSGTVSACGAGCAAVVWSRMTHETAPAQSTSEPVRRCF